MEDYIKSGFGADPSDQSYQAGSIRPVWQLTPLPLSQVRPHHHRLYPESPSTRKSLHSLCCTSISRHFHLYTPAILSSLPTHLIRLIFRHVQEDRGYLSSPMISGKPPYDTDADAESKETRRPDETTLWAYHAILDPEGCTPHHTLDIPTPNLLHHLPYDADRPQPDHPFVAIPKLYAEIQSYGHGSSSRYSLLTTLVLDGSDTVIDDNAIMALRWCTHLSVLWTTKCDITDAGIRLLTSALELPGPAGEGRSSPESQGKGKGMWRLRGWFLTGCRGVSDRSMRSFARWPGLNVLDVRETSCTEVGMSIFNRTSSSLFPLHAPFQPCTTGLRPIFSSRAQPSEITSNLCATLLKPSSTSSSSSSPPSSPSPSSRVRNRTTPPTHRHLALHLVPSFAPIPPECLPNPTEAIVSPPPAYGVGARSSNSTFRGEGIGKIYGADVSRLADPVRDLRTAVKNLPTAWRIEAELSRGIDRRQEWADAKWDDRGKKRKTWDRGGHDNGSGKDWDEKKPAPKGYKPSPYDSRGSSYVRGRGQRRGGAPTGSRGGQTARGKGVKGWRNEDKEEEEVKGDERLMMVRMVDEGWERSTWAVGSKADDKLDSQSAIHCATQITAKSRPSDLLSDILGSTQGFSSSSNVASSQIEDRSKTIGGLFRPRAATPGGDLRRPSGQQASDRIMSSSLTAVSGSPKLNPFRQATPQDTRQLPKLPDSTRESQSHGYADFGASSSKKRRFGGSEGMSAEVKRSGMRMFREQP